MSMADLERAFAEIAASHDADFAGEKPEELVVSAERALALTFPPTYRTFLRRLGCGSISGYEFYGVINNDFEHSGIPDAVWLTLDERRTANLEHSLVLVSHTGYTGYYAIDTSQKTLGGDSPIVEWQFGRQSNLNPVVAEDFGAFLWEQVQWAKDRN